MTSGMRGPPRGVVPRGGGPPAQSGRKEEGNFAQELMRRFVRNGFDLDGDGMINPTQRGALRSKELPLLRRMECRKKALFVASCRAVEDRPLSLPPGRRWRQTHRSSCAVSTSTATVCSTRGSSQRCSTKCWSASSWACCPRSGVRWCAPSPARIRRRSCSPLRSILCSTRQRQRTQRPPQRAPALMLRQASHSMLRWRRAWWQCRSRATAARWSYRRAAPARKVAQAPLLCWHLRARRRARLRRTRRAPPSRALCRAAVTPSHETSTSARRLPRAARGAPARRARSPAQRHLGGHCSHASNTSAQRGRTVLRCRPAHRRTSAQRGHTAARRSAALRRGTATLRVRARTARLRGWRSRPRRPRCVTALRALRSEAGYDRVRRRTWWRRGTAPSRRAPPRQRASALLRRRGSHSSALRSFRRPCFRLRLRFGTLRTPRRCGRARACRFRFRTLRR